MKRIATAVVLVPLATWLILKAPDWDLIAAFALVGLIAFREYDAITAGHGLEPAGISGMLAGLALLLAPAPGAVAVLIALAAMMIALGGKDLSRAMERAAVFTLGVIYIFGSSRIGIDLHGLSHHWLMFAMLVSWVGDTAAFYIGKPFGRHKLAPQVSPGKSWEGAVASLIAGSGSAVVYAHYFLPDVVLHEAIALAVAGNLAGQMGDLCESALKRGAGMKDSGSTLPGHGGWLDRIDAALFSIPVIYMLVKFWVMR